MKYCIKCKQVIDDGTCEYCSQCGTKLENLEINREETENIGSNYKKMPIVLALILSPILGFVIIYILGLIIYFFLGSTRLYENPLFPFITWTYTIYPLLRYKFNLKKLHEDNIYLIRRFIVCSLICSLIGSLANLGISLQQPKQTQPQQPSYLQNSINSTQINNEIQTEPMEKLRIIWKNSFNYCSKNQNDYESNALCRFDYMGKHTTDSDKFYKVELSCRGNGGHIEGSIECIDEIINRYTMKEFETEQPQ
ncbi:MAG: hypothetical protein NC191_02775 [Muribaculaceae bacterium]|nr:hypothetical protein [Muribaculaceae bacterium]